MQFYRVLPLIAQKRLLLLILPFYTVYMSVENSSQNSSESIRPSEERVQGRPNQISGFSI